MKKTIKLLSCLTLLFSLSSCSILNDILNSLNNDNSNIEDNTDDPYIDPVINPDPEPDDDPEYNGSTLYVVSINDFHGALEEDESNTKIPGMGKLATKIKKVKEEYGKDNVLIISNGDNFQGTFLSNVTYGRAVIDCMNDIGFDVSGIGNHEFDWGLDKIFQYWDGDTSNGEANFPIGSANIYKNGEDDSSIDNYHIFEKAGVRVGVIPCIGYGEESSILGSRVKDYSFESPLNIIKANAFDLRVNKHCDVVIVNIHDHNDSLNRELAKLKGNYLIDLVINGHDHQSDYTTYSRTGAIGMGSVEAYCNGGAYSLSTLSINKDKVVEDIDVNVYNTESRKGNVVANSNINDIVNYYIEESSSTYNKVLGIASEDISNSKSTYYNWIGKVIQVATSADIAISNTGGLRTIPYYNEGDSITYGNFYSVIPFDNEIKLVEINGKTIRNWISNNYTSIFEGYCEELEYSYGSQYRSNYYNIEDNKTYTVAVIDYLSENVSYSYIFQNDTYRSTGLKLRDLLMIDIQLQQSKNHSFYPDMNNICITPETAGRDVLEN